MSAIRNATGLLAFFGLWQALTWLGFVNDFMLPSPVTVAAAIWSLAIDGSLWVHIASSLWRVFAGFVLASVVGLGLGVLTGWSRLASDFVRPIVEALRPIPPLAWIPIAILWFGVGNAPSYFLVFIGAVFPIFVATFTAIRNIDRTQINAALCLGAGPGLLFRDVLIPASLPIIFPGLRIALGIGWMCVVTAELVAAQSGLGYLIQQSRLLFQIQNVVAGMVVIGLIGYAMSLGMEAVERRLNRWSPAHR